MSKVPTQKSPRPVRIRPVTIIGRVPILGVKIPVMGEITRGARVHGMVINPASSGLAP